MSKLMRNERPLLILPELAAEIGLNEAVILQQIHYWILKRKHVIEGKSWVYNTYEDWQKQFPFWSAATIARTLQRLEKQGLILTGNFNTMAFDKTKWYTICYGAMTQFGGMIQAEVAVEAAGLPAPIPEKNEQKNNKQKNINREAFLSECLHFEQSLGTDKVEEAWEIAAAKGITAWAYVRKILMNWEKDQQGRPEKTPEPKPLYEPLVLDLTAGEGIG
ncbi:DnaD domain-containing protein [Domibacillus indicus]|uniref:hypothetical protein n=1 Tax=Domibacillus indicus TaxID=1437523 RepID=UPI00069730EE|nr:hypothetical protein [Domibacillus indicus]